MPTNYGKPKVRRRNGLQWPPHELQVVTWILFPLLLLHFYAFIVPILWNRAYIPIIVVYTTLAAAAAVSAYTTCAIDPADDAVCTIISADGAATRPHRHSAESNQCHLCDARVLPSSKHCTHCGKCVEKFDHHCKWLNTCVGAKNYKYFLAVVTSVALLTSASLILSIVYIIDSFGILNEIRSRIERAGDRNFYAIDVEGVQGVSIVSVVLLLPLVALVYQLGFFHIMLIYRGLTTYEFIMMESRKQRELKISRAPQTPVPTSRVPTIAKPASSSNSMEISRQDQRLDIGQTRSLSPYSTFPRMDVESGSLEEKLGGNELPRRSTHQGQNGRGANGSEGGLYPSPGRRKGSSYDDDDSEVYDNDSVNHDPNLAVELGSQSPSKTITTSVSNHHQESAV